MSIGFQTIIPSSFIPKPLQSGSQHVIRRRQAEILPVSQVSYKHSGNDRLIFNINSSNEFLDAQNSYLKFRLHTYGIIAAAVGGENPVAAVDDPFLSLATGGAHALFKEVILRLQNGVEICRIQDYDKWYAMMSSVNESREHVDSFGWMYGDSVGRFAQFDPLRVKHIHDGSLVAADVVYAGLLRGDVDGTAVTQIYGPLVPENLDTIGIDDVKAGDPTNILEPTLRARSGGFSSARVQVCNSGTNTSPPESQASTAGRTVCMTIPLSILSMNQFLPLPFIQGGLQLEFVLNNPVYAMSLNDNVTPVATAEMDYAIMRPRFVTTMVQPSEEIQAQYLNLYKAGKLVYPFHKIQTFLNTNSGANGTFSFVMNPNVRSAVLAMSIAQNLNANTVTRTTNAYSNSYIYDCTGKFLKMGVNSYQYKVGSDNYPDIAVDCSDAYNAEAFAQTQKAFSHLSSIAFTPRAAPHEWWSINQDSGKTTGNGVAAPDEPIKFIMTTDLSRDGSLFSGVDISIAPFILECGTSGAYQLGAYNAQADELSFIRTFLTSNALLKVSSDGVSIIH